MPANPPSAAAGPWHDTPPTADRVMAVLARVQAAMRADAWRTALAAGLTPTQADMLALLATRRPGVRLGWLAEQLCISAATASDAVAALVAKGWVQKARAADDARALALTLTTAGQGLAGDLAAPAGVVRAAAAALAPDTQATLLAALLQLVGELQRSEGFPALRTCVSCAHFEPHRHPGSDAPHHCHLVGAPLPAALLRVDCPEHQGAPPAVQAQHWQALRA